MVNVTQWGSGGDCPRMELISGHPKSWALPTLPPQCKRFFLSQSVRVMRETGAPQHLCKQSARQPAPLPAWGSNLREQAAQPHPPARSSRNVSAAGRSISRRQN